MQAAILSALVVVAGQSNALGFGLTPAELPDYARTPDPRVQIWTPHGFETLRAGTNTGTPANPAAWGPEVAFAHAWRAAHPRERLYLVKSVKGSTSLAADPQALDWSPASRGELFDRTTQAVAEARAASGLAVSTILWMQGETDAGDAARSAAYARNLEALLRAMRRTWSDGRARIVVARIGEGPALPYATVVRAAEAEAAGRDTSAAVVETGGLPLQPDGLHLAAAGEMALGTAFYEAASPPVRAAGEP